MDKSTGVYQHKNPWMKIKTNQSIKKVTGERVIHQSIKNENKVVGEIKAGDTHTHVLKSGEAFRIFTGAMNIDTHLGCLSDQLTHYPL